MPHTKRYEKNQLGRSSIYGTLAGDFRSLLWDVEWYVEWYSYLLFKDPLLCWDGPLEIWEQEMRKAEGITWSQSVHCFFFLNVFSI